MDSIHSHLPKISVSMPKKDTLHTCISGRQQIHRAVPNKKMPASRRAKPLQDQVQGPGIRLSKAFFPADHRPDPFFPSQFLHAGVNPYTIVDCGAGANGASYSATGRYAIVDGVYAAADVTSNGAGLNGSGKNLVWLKDATTNKYERVAFGTANAVPARFATEAEAKVYANLHANNAKCKGFIIPWNMLEIRYGGNIAQVRELTENGGGPRRMMEAMAALVVQSPLTFGMFDYRASTANGGLLS